MNSTPSLEQNLKRLAMGWATGGLALTLGLSGSLFCWLLFADAQSEIEKLGNAAISSYRMDLLSGNVRTVELQLKKDFSLSEGEVVVFLNRQKQRWVTDFEQAPLAQCFDQSGVCRNWLNRKITVDQPLYFDEGEKRLWGYIHIERSPHPNWSIVLSVTLAILLGMIFQTFGFYFNLRKSISKVSATLAGWAKGLSVNPKDTGKYGEAPFQEMEPINKALLGLKSEIDALESAAHEEGALTTLSGIGHDILNPVSRMKRLMGLLTPIDPEQKELLASFDSNLKRLSNYAVQLKCLYKTQTGEISEEAQVTDVSLEAKSLLAEIQHDSEMITKKLNFGVSVEGGCLVQIAPTDLARIVENLCANSIHASAEGSSIFVNVKRSRDGVELSVEDQGEGIPLELQTKIFEPNFSTKRSKGTGLGLFVVKQICERYHGRIALSSIPGIGTKVKIEFPYHEGTNGAQASISR